MIMEEKPLLPPGLHDFELDDIGNHFLIDFPESCTRFNLIEGFKKYISLLSKVGIPIELWLDGSFTTKKTDPNDIDMVIFASEKDVNHLQGQNRNLLIKLVDRVSTRHTFGCDVLFSVKENENQRSYWRGWYGFDRNENPKGIVRIMVNT